MKTWQKFSAILFVPAVIIFSSQSVYGGADFGDGESAGEMENIIVETPEETEETPPENNFDEGNNIVIPPDNSSDYQPPILPENNPDENANENADDYFDSNDTYTEDAVKDSGIIGDVNGDNELNAIDLVILQKYLKGEIFSISETAADINGDGNISKLDAYALLNLIKGENKGTGDVNNDGKINVYDVQTLTAYFADKSTPINQKNADLSGDGKIDTKDLKILKGVIAALKN